MILAVAFFSLFVHVLALLVVIILTVRLKCTYVFVGLKGELLLIGGVFVTMFVTDSTGLNSHVVLLMAANSALRTFTLVSQLMGNPRMRRNKWDMKKRRPFDIPHTPE